MSSRACIGGGTRPHLDTAHGSGGARLRRSAPGIGVLGFRFETGHNWLVRTLDPSRKPVGDHGRVWDLASGNGQFSATPEALKPERVGRGTRPSTPVRTRTRTQPEGRYSYSNHRVLPSTPFQVPIGSSTSTSTPPRTSMAKGPAYPPAMSPTPEALKPVRVDASAPARGRSVKKDPHLEGGAKAPGLCNPSRVGTPSPGLPGVALRDPGLTARTPPG